MDILSKEYDRLIEEYKDRWFYIKHIATDNGNEQRLFTIYEEGPSVQEWIEELKEQKKKVVMEINANFVFLNKKTDRKKYLRKILKEIETIESEIFWDEDPEIVLEKNLLDIVKSGEIANEEIADEIKKQLSITIYELKTIIRQLIESINRILNDMTSKNEIEGGIKNSEEEEGSLSENKELKLYTEPQVADLIGLSARSLANRRKKGEIEWIKIGRNVRYSKENILNIIKQYQIKSDFS